MNLLYKAATLAALPSSPIYSSPPSCRTVRQGCDSYFRNYLFTASLLFLLRGINIFHFPLYSDSFALSPNEGIVGRPTKRPGISNDLSRNNLSRGAGLHQGTSQSTLRCFDSHNEL